MNNDSYKLHTISIHSWDVSASIYGELLQVLQFSNIFLPSCFDNGLKYLSNDGTIFDSSKFHIVPSKDSEHDSNGNAHYIAIYRDSSAGTGPTPPPPTPIPGVGGATPPTPCGECAKNGDCQAVCNDAGYDGGECEWPDSSDVHQCCKCGPPTPPPTPKPTPKPTPFPTPPRSTWPSPNYNCGAGYTCEEAPPGLGQFESQFICEQMCKKGSTPTPIAPCSLCLRNGPGKPGSGDEGCKYACQQVLGADGKPKWDDGWCPDGSDHDTPGGGYGPDNRLSADPNKCCACMKNYGPPSPPYHPPCSLCLSNGPGKPASGDEGCKYACQQKGHKFGWCLWPDSTDSKECCQCSEVKPTPYPYPPSPTPQPTPPPPAPFPGQ